MSKLRDVIAYICSHYPVKQELSNARLTKMVYLADWRSSILRGSQITDVEWIFNHYGPYVDDILSVAEDDPDFIVEHTENIYGNPKRIIRAKHGAKYPSLSADEKEVIAHVIESTRTKYWEQFIKLVYSTYPLVAEARFKKLDLPRLAEEYQEKAHLLEE